MSFGFLIAALLSASPVRSGEPAERRWSRGLSETNAAFPIGVWLQDPRNAPRFRAAGINVYVGLWKGPTAEQLDRLRSAGMPVICTQNDYALSRLDDPIIVGWMHDDEPDNAQPLPSGSGYGPPIPPESIRTDYERMRKADPTRPILLNLGQGVAWDDYIGRGVRRNHPEDYPRYVEGADIVSFDIYPAVHENPAVAGKLEFVARGVERLVRWAGPRRSTWNCIECTRIDNPNAKPTPAQVRAEVWMSLIRGSRGLIYFVHQFQPVFREAALLDDPEMLAEVGAINRRVAELAPVLHASPIASNISATSDPREAPVAWMHRRHAGSDYLFAVLLANRPARVAFDVGDRPDGTRVDDLQESRSLAIRGRRFEDTFESYGVRLYRFPAPSRP